LQDRHANRAGTELLCKLGRKLDLIDASSTLRRESPRGARLFAFFGSRREHTSRLGAGFFQSLVQEHLRLTKPVSEGVSLAELKGCSASTQKASGAVIFTLG